MLPSFLKTDFLANMSKRGLKLYTFVFAFHFPGIAQLVSINGQKFTMKTGYNDALFSFKCHRITELIFKND